MSLRVRLYIVTDDPDRASVDCFHRMAVSAPPWAKFVTGHAGILAIPTGARVFPSFHSARRSIVEQLWTEERVKPGRAFRDDYFETFDMLADWRRRQRGEEALPVSGPAPVPESGPDSGPDLVPVTHAGAGAPAADPLPGKTRKVVWS